MVDWGPEYGCLPAEIWCFVILKGLEKDDNGQPAFNYGGIDLTDGTYAVVESSFLSKKDSELKMSDIFVPFQKEVAATSKDGVVTGLTVLPG